MWTTLAFVSALSLAPAQSGELALTNDRISYGYLGATRPDNKFLPGDIVHLHFDIENVKVDDKGEVKYSMKMEVLDSKGKRIFGQDPSNQTTEDALGGNRVPAHAYVECGSDQQPGEYTVKITVTDRVSKSTKTLERKFELVKLDFGTVWVGLTMGPNGNTFAPPIHVIGQRIYVNFGVVGFERDKAKKQPNVGVEMRVLDDNGKAALSKPFLREYTKDVRAEDKVLPVQFTLDLNRAGKFTIEVQTTDRISKKTAKFSYPIQVLQVK